MKFTYKYNLFFFALCFPVTKVLAQQTTTKYQKDDVEVTENDPWDRKMVILKSIQGGNELTSVSGYNQEGVLINKTVMNVAADKKSMKTITEQIYPEYGFKSYSENNVGVGKSNTVSKCTTLKGKVVFADRECEENGKPLDEEFGKFVGKNAQNIFRGEEGSIKYSVSFSVHPDYTITVNRINKKPLPENNSQLSGTEKAIIKMIVAAPSKFFEGNLRKIGGEFAKTTYVIPIHYEGGY